MRLRVQNYKGIFIAVTVLMMILMYCYVNNYSGASASAGGSIFAEALRLLILMCYLGILVLSSIDVFYANRLSVLIGAVTDG